MEAVRAPGSRAEIGYWIGERYWGRGSRPLAVGEAMRYAFASLGVDVLTARTDSDKPGIPAGARKMRLPPRGQEPAISAADPADGGALRVDARRMGSIVRGEGVPEATSTEFLGALGHKILSAGDARGTTCSRESWLAVPHFRTLSLSEETIGQLLAEQRPARPSLSDRHDAVRIREHTGHQLQP